MSDVLLPQKWADEDPTGWWVSEKLDGVRALWRNGEFVSRGDHAFICPDWFRRKMPGGCVLDGEIWGGRGQFQKTVGIVKNASRGAEWEFLTYMVFDALQDTDGTVVERRPFEDRYAVAGRICEGGGGTLKLVPMEKCKSRAHICELLEEVERQGGEGLMLRAPKSVYEHRRSHTLLKVKSFHDEEAIVVGHEAGKGRVSGMCGALVCKTPDGRNFKVGSGLSDAQRRSPPKIGAVITYRYQELTAANIPRFPTLVGERIDLDWGRVCGAYTPPDARAALAMKRRHSVLFGADGEAAPAAAAASAAPAAPPRAAPLKRTLTAVDVMQRGIPEEDLEDLAGDEPLPPPADKRPRAEAPGAAAAAARRPQCPYGAKCYRKNPMHFAEYSHPWIDAENEVPAAAASSGSGAAGSSSGSAPSAEASGAASSGGARSSADTGPAAPPPRPAASPGTAPDEARPALSSLLLTFVEEPSASSAAPPRPVAGPAEPTASPAPRATAPAPAPEVSELGPSASAAVAALLRGDTYIPFSAPPAAPAPSREPPPAVAEVAAASSSAPPRPAADPAPRPPAAAADPAAAPSAAAARRPAAAPGGRAGGGGATGSSDVRLIALRNLLTGLSRDAATEAERGHFLDVLELLEAGPSSGSPAPLAEVPPPAQPAVRAAPEAAAPPAVPALAAAAATAPEPAAPAPVAAVPAPGIGEQAGAAFARAQSVELLGATEDPAGEQLRSMGFQGPDVEEALRLCGGLDAALEWLLVRSAA